MSLLSKESNLLLEGLQTEKQITNAIRDNKLIKFYYNGDDNNKPGFRVVEPYVLGYTSAGNLAVRCWLVSGMSGSPYGKPGDKLSEKPGWRMFRLDRMEGSINYLGGGEKKDGGHKVFDASEEFIKANRPKYNPEDKDLKEKGKGIIIALQPKKSSTTLNEEYLNRFYKIINLHV